MSFLDQFFVYHPDPWKDQDWRPRLSGVAAGRRLVSVCGRDAACSGWYVEIAATSSAVVLWCHGNAGNIINQAGESDANSTESGLSVFHFRLSWVWPQPRVSF